MSKSILIFWVLIGISTSVMAAPVNHARSEGVSYKVIPGNWNKAVMSTPLAEYIDKDLNKETNTRKGMLIDGVFFQPGAVRYNYKNQDWNQNKISVEMDLGKERKVIAIKLFTLRANNLYDVKKVLFEGSEDGVEFDKIAELKEESIKLNKNIFEAEADAKGKNYRIVKITAWTSSWIDLAEVEVWGE